MKKNNPFELTRNEIISAGQAVAGIRVFIQATKWHFGFERGQQVFLRTMSDALEIAHEHIGCIDFTEMDSWELIHRWWMGRLIETFKEKLQNTSTQDSLRNVKWEAMAVAALYASWWQTYEYYCEEELVRRDAGVLRFLNLALGEPSSNELAMVKTDLAGVMKEKFVLSERHSSEHGSEKGLITNEAIAIVATRLQKMIDKNPDEFLSQLVATLNHESSPLSYLPYQVKNQFVKIVEKQISRGKHWDDSTADDENMDNYDIQTLDKEFWREAKMEWLDTVGHELPADSNPEKEVCHGNIEDLIDEIENRDSRLGKVARVYFEADMEDEKRPTQSEVADCLNVTDRTVRNRLQELRVFLEKKNQEK